MSEIEKTKPSLVVVNKQTYISTRRWSDHALLEFFKKTPGKWHSLGEIAKIAYGTNCAATRDRVRLNMPKLWRYALFQHGLFLVTETAPPHGRVTAVKVLDRSSEVEQQRAVDKLTRLHSRKELDDKMYTAAMKTVFQK